MNFAVAGSFGFAVFSAIWEITSAITQIKSTKELRQEISGLRRNEKNGRLKQTHMVFQ